MANDKHLKLLKQGVEGWNLWRAWNSNVRPNLGMADLRGAYLIGADLREANLRGAYLRGAYLRMADLREANLREANLGMADLTGANLTGADLTRAGLIATDLRDANLTGCLVYGISAWDLKLSDSTIQANLVISRVISRRNELFFANEPIITVDNLEVAQFIYLLLNNEKIRDVIQTITSKVVLILGRFTPERKDILDAIRDELRKRDWLPVLFDFDKPGSRDITETVSTLAHMARFIIADITDAKSIPQELHAIVPNLPSVPVQPLLEGTSREYGMFEHFKRFPWVLDIHRYATKEELIVSLYDKVIAPAEAKAKELESR